jgi:uncharacterized membrane protein YgcG
LGAQRHEILFPDILQDWTIFFLGWVNAKASQVRAASILLQFCNLATKILLQRYKIVNALPKQEEEIKTIAEMMYKRMLDREEEGIVKLRGVIDFATNDDCESGWSHSNIFVAYAAIGLAQGLASYFGDDAAIPTGLCGSCSFCQTGEGIDFESGAAIRPDPMKIKAILQACPERDDPRLLARMAFGITSPRLTAGKWSTSHPLFGSMVAVEFHALVEAFDKECAREGYVKADTPPSTAASRKRPSSQSTSYSGSHNRGGSSSGRGGASKRARRGWINSLNGLRTSKLYVVY